MHPDIQRIASAVLDARPVSRDLSNPGVQAAHHALDMFVHFYCDKAVVAAMLVHPAHRFDRQKFLAATDTPDNRFAR